MTPALSTRMCTGPLQARTNADTDDWSDRSSGATAISCPVVSATSAAVFSPAIWLRTAMVTSAPAPASARAVSMPMPDAPPVTTARRPVRSTPAMTSAAVDRAVNGLLIKVESVMSSVPLESSGASSATSGTNRRHIRFIPRTLDGIRRCSGGAAMTTSERPLRADARRNRDRLLEVAVRTFSQDGPDATLEGIAREAGVGIGTLYRHFPTREALVEAAYRNELARLCDAVPDLLAALPGDAALRAWMDRFVDYMTTKRGMSDALRAVVASGGNPFAQSRDRLLGAVEALVAAAEEDGTLRPGLDPTDVLTGLTGVTLAAGRPEQRAQAGRLLDLLVDGLRYRPGPS